MRGPIKPTDEPVEVSLRAINPTIVFGDGPGGDLEVLSEVGCGRIRTANDGRQTEELK